MPEADPTLCECRPGWRRPFGQKGVAGLRRADQHRFAVSLRRVTHLYGVRKVGGRLGRKNGQGQVQALHRAGGLRPLDLDEPFHLADAVARRVGLGRDDEVFHGDLRVLAVGLQNQTLAQFGQDLGPARLDVAGFQSEAVVAFGIGRQCGNGVHRNRQHHQRRAFLQRNHAVACGHQMRARCAECGTQQKKQERSHQVPNL